MTEKEYREHLKSSDVKADYINVQDNTLKNEKVKNVKDLKLVDKTLEEHINELNKTIRDQGKKIGELETELGELKQLVQMIYGGLGIR